MGSCEKHDQTMDRIFSTLSKMDKELGEISTKQDSIIAFKNDVHKVIYGNGQEGLLSKVRRALSQLVLQWGVIFIIIGALVGYAITLFNKG